MQGLASLLNPIREFVTRQPRPEVDQLMQDIQGRITEFMGSPVGPPNNIFEEPMPSRPMLGIPDQLLSASPEKEPLQVKTNLDPSLEFSNKTVDLYEKFDMNRPLEAIASQQNMFRIPQFNYGKEHAEMRMMQRDIKSPEEAAYISKVLGTDTPTDQGVNAIPTDLMAGFRSSEFALPRGAITDMAMGNVGLADGRNFRFGSLAETGAFRNYLDSIGQEYNKNTGMSMFNIPPAIPGLPSIFR